MRVERVEAPPDDHALTERTETTTHTPSNSPVSAAPPPTVLSSADEPIRSHAEDLLGRSPFAKAIADALTGWTGRRSLVVAIIGAWGTGKSSVKNMVRERLAAAPPEHRPHLLEFSPWQWSGSDQLAAGFFREVGIALGLTDRHRRNTRLAKLFAAYAAMLNAGASVGRSVQSLAWYVWAVSAALVLAGVLARAPSGLLGVLLTLAAVGAVIGVILKTGGQAAQAIGAVFGARAFASTRTLEELKADLAKELAKRSRPLVVIIDDVDRLSAAEIPLLFQLVKANADFPNVVYLLLFQRDIVEKALERAAPGRDARGYLDKIVQVPFTLPPVERSRLDAVLGAGLDAVLGDLDLRRRFDQHRWQNLYLATLRPYFRTLRDVRRFLNTLAFHASMFRGSGTFEVNPVDLVALEVLRVFEPELYDTLHAAKELLTGDQPRADLYGKEQENAARAEILAVTERGSKERRPEIRVLIKELFPRTAWAFDRVDAVTVGEESFRELRVGHPDVFDRYFLLATPQGDISEAELQGLISVTHDREGLVREFRQFRGRGLLPAALDRLDSYKDQIALPNAVPLATALFDVGDDLSDDKSGGSFLIPAALSPGRIIKWNLLQEPDAHERARLLEQAIKATTGLFLPVRQVSLERREGSSAGKSATWLLDGSDVPRMQALCSERLAAAAADGSLDRQPHLAYLLYRWKEWTGPDVPSAYVQRLVETPAGVVAFLRGFVHDMRRGAPGELVPRVIPYIRPSELEDFVRLDLLEPLVISAENSSLEEGDRVVVNAFWAALRRKREGRWEDDV